MQKSKLGEQASATAESKPVCQSPDLAPRKPSIYVPPNACDCHAHIFGDPQHYAMRVDRRYTPAVAGLNEYRHMLSVLGLEHAVIVQPTIYHDNQVTLDALESSQGKWRGILLPNASLRKSELDHLHAIGVRGMRFHPKPGEPSKLNDLEAVCELIAPYGWHAQFHLDARDLVELGPRLRRLPVNCVIDHLGHMKPASEASVDDPGFMELLRMLAEGQAWVKLSAAFRFGDPMPPYPAVAPFASALVAANPQRAVWASDWPHSSHTGFMPNDADLLDLLGYWVPNSTTRNKILVDNPACLYDIH